MNDEICFEESYWKSLVSFGIDESLMRIVMSVFELMISIVFVIIEHSIVFEKCTFCV